MSGSHAAVLDGRHGSALDAALARVRTGTRDDLVVTLAHAMVALQLVTLPLVSDLSPAGRLAGTVLALLLAVILAISRWTRSAGLRGLGALIGGLLGLSVGGSIAASWLTTAGLSWPAAVGAAAAAGGAALLVTGAWGLLRLAPGWWRLLALPIGFVILQLGILPLAGAVYGTHPPRTPLSSDPPVGARPVALRTAGDATLIAWYTPPRQAAAVILLPGSNGEKGSTLGHAAVLIEHGYGVLALDARGSGESAGAGNAWGWGLEADVLAAADWLAARPEVEEGRIAALGLSMGGEVAITAAAEPGSMLAAVVAEGVSARVPEDLAYLPEDPAGTTQRLVAAIMWSMGDLMTDARAPLPLSGALSASRAPVLLIAGSDADEAAAAPRLEAASPLVETWTVPATPHLKSLDLHPVEWRARVLGFLDGALGA